MALTGLLHRLGHSFTDHEADLPCPAELAGHPATGSPSDPRNQLSALGPSQPRSDATAGAHGCPAGGSGTAGAGPATHDGDCWQYLIASSSRVGDRLSWTLMGPSTGVDVDGDATPEHVASALGRQGWRMVTTSPPAPTDEGTINYIFRRSVA